MILKKTQAEAVYSAMCALNNVSGFLRTTIDTDEASVRVEEDDAGIRIMQRLRTVEEYATQSAFAAAYGLQTEGQQRRAERRARDEPYLVYGVEETRTGSRA